MSEEKKRLAVMKLGGSNGRICFGKIAKDGSLKPSRDITSGCSEAKIIIEMIERTGKFDITVVTKVLDGDYLPDKYKFLNVLELAKVDMKQFMNENHFDYIVVINGSINCFGGAEDAMIPDLCIYRMIRYCTGKVIYCQCDLGIQMMNDVFEYISGKPWSVKYNKEDYDLSEKDNIYMLTQAYDIDAHMKNILKPKNYQFKRDHVDHFSFEKYPCIMPYTFVKKNDRPEFDLGYGGTLRGGKRIKKLAYWYFNHPGIKVNLYGKLEDDKLINEAKKQHGDACIMPSFDGICNFVDNGKVLNRALATIVIGDAIFEKTKTVQQRAYQAMRANVVTFIDEDLDVDHRIYGTGTKFADFMYVKDHDCIGKRIQVLKSTPGLVDNILEEQNKIVNFNVDDWIGEFGKKVTQ